MRIEIPARARGSNPHPNPVPSGEGTRLERAAPAAWRFGDTPQKSQQQRKVAAPQAEPSARVAPGSGGRVSARQSANSSLWLRHALDLSSVVVVLCARLTGSWPGGALG